MQNRKYRLNETCFDVLTEESMYWLGFLSADGNICCENKVRLWLQGQDKSHLIKYLNFIDSDRPIYYKLQQGKYDSYGVDFRSNYVIKRLSHFGLNTRKNNRQFIHKEILQSEYFPAFIRGYFDGDGCLYHRGKLIYSELTGYLPTINVILDYLLKHDIIKNNKIYKNGSIFRLRFYSKDTENLLEFLYKDATVYLDRKYYFRPTKYMNIGKQKEVQDRKMFKVNTNE